MLDPYREEMERFKQPLNKISVDQLLIETNKEVETVESLRSRKERKQRIHLISVLCLLFLSIILIVFVSTSYIKWKDANRADADDTTVYQKDDIKKELVHPLEMEQDDELEVTPEKKKEVASKTKAQTQNKETTTKKESKKQQTRLEKKKNTVENQPQTNTNNNAVAASPSVKNEDTTTTSNKTTNKTLTHVVQANDTLFSISMKYYHSKDGIDKIIAANGIVNNKIEVGQTLTIPQ